MESFIVNERKYMWSEEKQTEVHTQSHEIAMADVTSIQTLWGGVIFNIKNRVLIVFPNGDAQMGYMQSVRGDRTFVCDGVGTVKDPLPILAHAHKLWPNARVARESTFREEVREPKELACKYRG